MFLCSLKNKSANLYEEETKTKKEITKIAEDVAL